MAVQKRLVKAGISKQSGKGSTETDATYAFGVNGGNIINADVSEDDLDPTADTRVTENRERTLVVPGVDTSTIVMPDSIGLLLNAVAGNITTTGTGPYTHDFTPGDDLPYMTLFADFDADKREVHDAKVEELSIEWDGSGAAEVSYTASGLDVAFDSTYSETNYERPTDPLRGAGGTFNVDGAAAKVSAGSITVTNNLEPVDLSDSVKPDDVFPGKQDVELSLTLIPDSLVEWRHAVTGSESGTAIQQDPRFGSVDLTLAQGGSDTLQFTADNIAFMSAFPEADPSAGPTEVELEGTVVRPDAGGDEFTFTLTNSVSTY